MGWRVGLGLGLGLGDIAVAVDVIADDDGAVAVARGVEARVGDGTLGLDHDPGTTVRLGLGRQRAVHLDVDRIEPLLAFFEFKIEAPRGAGFSDRVGAGAEDGGLWDGDRHHCSGGTNMSSSRVQTRSRWWRSGAGTDQGAGSYGFSWAGRLVAYGSSGLEEREQEHELAGRVERHVCARG